MISQNTVNKFLYVFLCALLLISASRADDTDIYLSAVAPSGSEPFVMFSLDFRPSVGSVECTGFPNGSADDAAIAVACSSGGVGWDSNFVSYFSSEDRADGKFSYFEMIKASVKRAIAPLDGVKVGLMISHNDHCTGGSSNCSNGGYILSGFKLLDGSAAGIANKNELNEILSEIPDPSGTNAHPFQGKELYFEFFRYLTGQEIHNGHNGYFDYGTNNDDNLDVDNDDIDWDDSIEINSNTDYQSPLLGALSCAKIFVVNVMFGVTQSDGDSDVDIRKTKANGGMNSVVLTGSSNNFNTVINWMYNNDLADNSYGSVGDINGNQNVTSYFLVKSTNGGTHGTVNGFAYDGGTNAAISLGDDPAELERTFKNLFAQILSVSTTFVSASVPVNVFNRSQVSENVYIALFEAEENAKPQWVGNVKKLKLLKDVSGALYIGDVNSAQAFAADGRINYSAKTFWTNATGADVVAADTTKNEISGFDGRSVNRGGAGQQVKGFLSGSPGTSNVDVGARQLFTDPDTFTAGTATSFRDLNADAATATALWGDLNKDGVISSGTDRNADAWSVAATYAASTAAEKVEAVDILKFARGIDVMDQDGDTSRTDTRPWLMGDSIHSRPVPINYGATGSGYDADNPDIRILVGSNDGYLRMYKNTKTDDSESGEEVWAFMPREVMPAQKRLKDNAAGTPVHPYGLDGAPTVYVLDDNNDGTIKAADNDKVILFFGLRRGGKAYYALDLTTPDSPKFLWKITSADTDFTELALTFSTPHLGVIKYDVAPDTPVTKPVLIFGGGYDTNKDTRNSSPGTDDSSGNGIFIVDAMDGTLIWKAVHHATTTGNDGNTKYTHVDLVDSIPSDVSAVDTNNDRRVDRIYVGDTGGSVWRVNLTGTDRTNWTVAKFANIGRHYNSGKFRDRRFFHRPDFVRARDASGPFDAIILGSGDRANPLDTDIGSSEPLNYLFMLKDRGGATTNLQHSALSNLTDNCIQDVNETCSASQISDLSNGWKVKLEQVDGEKNLSTPVTLNGFVFFTTYSPPESGGASCGPAEGRGSLYVMNLQDATAVIDFNKGNTDEQNGVFYELQEEDRIRSTGSGIPAEVVALGDNYVLPPGSNPISVPAQTRWKTFWYINNQ